MFYLAYDGSLNGDWVARYAVQLAAGSDPASLTLLHVRDDTLPATLIAEKLAEIERLCAARGVSLTRAELARHGKVETTLLKVLPDDAGHLLICGTRGRKRARGYLAGTVTERLLAASQIPVLALRVVQPGLLGQPRSLLLPFAGHPRGCRHLAPLLRPLLGSLDIVHLLRAMTDRPRRLLHLTAEQRLHLRAVGYSYLHHVRTELERLAPDKRTPRIDEHLTICADWGIEILMLASRLKVQLTILGTGRQPLRRPWLRPAALERLLAATPCDVGIYSSP